MISHDLSVVRYMADRVGVMYLGKIVEVGTGDDIYERPAPSLHRRAADGRPGARTPRRTSAKAPQLASAASCPSPVNPPSGCRFHTRCPKAQEKCARGGAAAAASAREHVAACHFPLHPPMDGSGDIRQTEAHRGGARAAARITHRAVSATPRPDAWRRAAG